jgi:hypothetical protein
MAQRMNRSAQDIRALCERWRTMERHLKAAVILASLAISLTCAGLSGAQKSTPVPSAPVPAQILSAKKVFIANGGGDESRFESPQYTGGPDRLCNEFYAAMKSWGRYELVSSPAQADLIFEISLTHHTRPPDAHNLVGTYRARASGRLQGGWRTLWVLVLQRVRVLTPPRSMEHAHEVFSRSLRLT